MSRDLGLFLCWLFIIVIPCALIAWTGRKRAPAAPPARVVCADCQGLRLRLEMGLNYVQSAIQTIEMSKPLQGKRRTAAMKKALSFLWSFINDKTGRAR